MLSTRLEKDSLGEIEVPADAWWGAQSERARRNFPVSGLVFPRRSPGRSGVKRSNQVRSAMIRVAARARLAGSGSSLS